MNTDLDRRAFLKIAGFGSVVFASCLHNWVPAEAAGKEDFFFVQLSDPHWGFNNPQINPDSTGTLKKAIAATNALKTPPEFIVFTGDLTQITDDDQERRKRMNEFRNIIKELKVKVIKLMPGEHDAGVDEGKAFKEMFGETHYTFDHKGIHFIVLDNVSDPRSILGETQLEWLAADLKKIDKNTPIVVFTHRPLYDLYPEWEWYTRDGNKALDLLMPFSKVNVFHGHIHQEHHQMTGHIAHHAAKGLMWPLPAAGSVPVKAAIPWDPAQPYKGLGFREVEAVPKEAEYRLTEFSVKGEVVK